jgi:hypothetical protein
MRNLLTPEKALIFRITHRDNLPWILANGLHCRNSNRTDSHFVSIGNPDLISSREHHPVGVLPGGRLSDYIPFYFTPLSMMLYNIHTGYRGVRQRRNEEIVFIVSSLRRLKRDGITFLFTDRHASLAAADYSHEIDDLSKINWRILQNRDFQRDPDNPEKTERYQAEALVHKHLPTSSLLGIVCYDEKEHDTAKTLVEQMGLELRTDSRPGWYFR